MGITDISNKKKILIYSDCYLFGGSEHLMVSLLKNKRINELYEIHFAFRAHSIYIKNLKKLFTREEYSSFHPLRILSNETISYKINQLKYPKLFRHILYLPLWILAKIKLYDLYNFIRLRLFITKLKPDLIHINNGGYPAARSCSIMVIAASKTPYKNVILQINNLAEFVLKKNEIKLDQTINNTIKYFITSSVNAKNILAKRRNFPLEKIINIPNTIRQETITKSREQIAGEFNVSADSVWLTEVALLQHRKGQIYLLEALCKLRVRQPDFFSKLILFLVGIGEDEANIRTYIDKHHLTSTVFLTGYRNDYINFINACDIFLLPSIANEDMPLVNLTAMNLGKAIISTNLAGIPEEIQHGISGLLVEPDEQTISQALSEVIPEAFINKETLGLNAQKQFSDFFSEIAYSNNILKLYANTLAE